MPVATRLSCTDTAYRWGACVCWGGCPPWLLVGCVCVRASPTVTPAYVADGSCSPVRHQGP